MARTAMRLAVVTGVAALLLPSFAVPASAHVTADPDRATSPYFRTDLRVGHGCEGSPTTEVRVRIPEGAENPRAEPVLGWEVEVVTEELDEPVTDSHGSEITERVAELAWVDGTLPDEQFQEFGLSFRVAEDAPDVLWLPTIQECEEGEHRWIEIPDSVAEWGDLEEPAPYVEVDLDGGSEEEAEDGAAEEAGAAAENRGGPATVAVTGAALAALLALILSAAAFVRSGRAH